MKKKITIFLTIILFLLLLPACGAPAKEVIKTEDIYIVQNLLPEDFGFFIQASWEQEHKIYLNGACIDDPKQPVVWSFDTESGELTETKRYCPTEKIPAENAVLCTTDSEYMDENGNCFCMSMTFQSMEDTYREYYKFIFDSEGFLSDTVDMTDSLWKFENGSFGYLENMTNLPDGGVLFTYMKKPMVSSLVRLAEDGTVLFDKLLDSHAEDVQVTEDGRIFVVEKAYVKNTISLLKIDQNTGKKKTIVKEIKNTTSCRLANGNDQDRVYFLTDEGLFVTDEKGREIVQIFNLSDLLVAHASDVMAISRSEDDTWCALADMGGKTSEKYFYNYNFLRIQKNTEKNNAAEMSVALIDADQLMLSKCREAAVAYNKSQSNVKIVINQYESVDVLAKEILAGKIPDLIDIHDAALRDSLEKKGLLENLNPYFERDDSISQDDFLENALRIYEKDGTLYAIPDRLSIMALAGNADALSDIESWNFEEFKAFLQTLSSPEGAVKYLDRKDFLEYVCPVLLSHFVNRENLTCDFDTEEFRNLLQLLKSCPDTEYGEMDFEKFYDDVQGGNFRLLMAGFTGVQDYELLMTMYDHNAKIIGFPTDDRNGVFIVPEGIALSITSTCANKEIAWDFLKSVLTAEGSYEHMISSYRPNYIEMIEHVREEADDPEPAMQLPYGNAMILNIPHANAHVR